MSSFYSFHDSFLCQLSLLSNASDFQASSSILNSLVVSIQNIYYSSSSLFNNFCLCHLSLLSNNKTGVIFKLVLFLFDFELASCLTFFIFVFPKFWSEWSFFRLVLFIFDFNFPIPVVLLLVLLSHIRFYSCFQWSSHNFQHISHSSPAFTLVF